MNLPTFLKLTSRSALSVSEGGPQYGLGRVVTAHAVDPSAWRRRCRAEEEVLRRSRIGDQAGGRAREELPDVHHPPSDVAPDKILIVPLEIPRIHGASREDPVAKPGREPLQLRLDPLGHVKRGAIGHVTVGPRRLLPFGGARIIAERL